MARRQAGPFHDAIHGADKDYVLSAGQAPLGKTAATLRHWHHPKLPLSSIRRA